jgi:hypothetical protein
MFLEKNYSSFKASFINVLPGIIKKHMYPYEMRIATRRKLDKG